MSSSDDTTQWDWRTRALGAEAEIKRQTDAADAAAVAVGAMATELTVARNAYVDAVEERDMAMAAYRTMVPVEEAARAFVRARQRWLAAAVTGPPPIEFLRAHDDALHELVDAVTALGAGEKGAS